MQVQWIKCQNDQWCSLNNVDLEDQHFENLEGVYVIWCSDDGSYIKVGQGNIKDRIATHREDPDIQSYADRGLLVTWARLRADLHDAVERRQISQGRRVSPKGPSGAADLLRFSG